MGLPEPPARALVTGASSGLGVALAEALAARGHALVLAARRRDRLEEVAGVLRAEHGVEVQVVECDVADAAAREELYAAAGDVEVLVNNAGFTSGGRFQDLDGEREAAMVRVNVEAVVALCGHFLPAMVARGRGGVLNMGSTTGFQPLPRHATYAASKAFVLSFTETLHADLAGTGVHATALCPGPVRTELLDSTDFAAANDSTPGFVWTDAEHVAREGVRGLERNKRVVVPGVLNRLGTIGGQHAPRAVLLRLAPFLSPSERH